MIVVGLTGGIASGKTSILNFIKKQNIPTHDSDAVVASLYNKPSKEFINYLKSNGFWIIGVENSIKSDQWYNVDYKGKIAIVVGSEGEGILHR